MSWIRGILLFMDKFSGFTSSAERVAYQAKRTFERFRTNLELAAKRFYGKRITVIGPKAAGKTTFLKVLREPHILSADLTSYVESENETVNSFMCSWNIPVGAGRDAKFRFKIKKCKDVGGEEIYRNTYWKENVTKSQLIFYLISWEKHEDSQYVEQLQADFHWFAKIVNGMETNSRIVILFNKVDKFCKTPDEYQIFIRKNSKTADDLVALLSGELPTHYRTKVAGYTFTSLTDEVLRNECFVEIIKTLLGENLLQRYKQNGAA